MAITFWQAWPLWVPIVIYAVAMGALVWKFRNIPGPPHIPKWPTDAEVAYWRRLRSKQEPRP